jgi:hypothetical protein
VDDDAGAEFMSFFYSHWKMADPAEALRLAQLDMKGKYGFRDWAGYQYSGSWRPSRGNIEVRPKAPNPESISTPACVEASAHETDGNWTTFEKARFRLGAVVRRVQSSPTSTTYEMLYPGSEVEYTWSTSINHGPPVPNGVVRVASGINHQILVTIENQRGQSSLTIQELGRGTPVLTITLKGPPTLFPSLEIPQAFPPLGSYTEATLATGGKNGLKTIDSLKTCGTGPLR